MRHKHNVRKMLDARRDVYSILEGITFLLGVSFLGVALFLILVALSYVPEFSIFSYVCMAIYFYFMYPFFFYKRTYVLIAFWMLVLLVIFI